MSYGFGITAHPDSGLVAELAAQVEALGYESFWVNGSPPEQALGNLQAAAGSCTLPLGVGVLPLTRITAEEIITATTDLGLPPDRLSIGVGSNRRPGALAEVRGAVATLRSKMPVRIVTGAVGPKMTSLGGEIADDVLFTWWPAAAIPGSRRLVEEGARAAGRPPPRIASYIRCALLPGAAESLTVQAARYSAIPRYAKAFALHDVTAEETVVAGRSSADLRTGIEEGAAVLDVAIIRAITADESLAAFGELAEACAPGA